MNDDGNTDSLVRNYVNKGGLPEGSVKRSGPVGLKKDFSQKRKAISQKRKASVKHVCFSKDPQEKLIRGTKSRATNSSHFLLPRESLSSNCVIGDGDPRVHGVSFQRRLESRGVNPFLLFFLSFIILHSTFFIQRVFAQTEVGGEVWGTWNTDGSPYLVIDTLTIPEGNTLIIEPGVTVEFQDQGERRYPFYIHGTLSAIGSGIDSIYFNSPDSAFPGFISPEEIEGSRIHLEYCVVDSAILVVQSSYGVVTLRHSSLVGSYSWVNTEWDEADTIQYCTFQKSEADDVTWGWWISSGHIGSSVFQNNYGPEARYLVSYCDELSPIFGNSIREIDLWEVPGCEVYDNEMGMVTCRFGNDTLHIYDNTLLDSLESSIYIHASKAIIENNITAHIEIDTSFAIIRNNWVNTTYSWPVEPSISLYTSEFQIYNNLITSVHTGMRCRTNYGEPFIRNNTIVFREIGLRLPEDELDLRNNLFIGDGYQAYAYGGYTDRDTQPGIVYNKYPVIQLTQPW